MEIGEEVVTLSTLAQGAALERFQDALGEVLKNIADPNTDAEAARKIVLTVTFVPADDRRMGDVKIDTKLQLAPATAVGTRVFFGKHQGQHVAVEHDPRQMRLGIDRPGEVVSIQPKA